MQYKKMGNSGLQVSALAFGTMSFGDTIDEKTARRVFDRCRELGINHFDCADVYAGGRAEEILGRFIRSCRDELVVATKGYFPTEKHPNGRGSTRYHLVRAVEDSLRRLGTDRIDIYYLHRFDDDTPLEETLRTLDDLIKAGKILYLGASNFAAWQLAKANGVAALHGWQRLVCLQPMYNLVKRQAEVELLPYAQYDGLAVFPYNPLAAGLLTGKYGKDIKPAVGRLVENKMYATRYGEPEYLDTAVRFGALAREMGYAPAALAMAWVAAHPAVTSPVVGVRSLEHLEVAASSLEIPMTAELRLRISALSPTPPPATDRNEEGSAHNFTAVTQKTAK
jgi:aryl-alcohol dehydrogenase-like predicted oxidoreductase